MDNIEVFSLYNNFVKLSINIFRTKDKKYLYKQQLAPARNLYFEKEYPELNYELKSLILCEIINGYIIQTNLLGLDFVDDLMSCIEE
jgi:hypothetical protein|tara:strand:+ start:849 stop:1109 length:261 start_codon:yes stop_codon:yes gene_type:complete